MYDESIRGGADLMAPASVQSLKRQSLSPAELDQLATELNEVCRNATLDLAYHVGELIVKRIFGGIEAWQATGTRQESYRQLATRKDLLMGPSGLCRAVGVYLLSERLGGRAQWRHLSASHLTEVLPLEPSQQDRLLKVAENERWTVARLRAEVRMQRAARQPRYGSVVRASRRAADNFKTRSECLTKSEVITRLPDESIEELSDILRELREYCQSLEGLITQNAGRRVTRPAH